jgi:NADH-quinone oxidoreductase subunit M
VTLTSPSSSGSRGVRALALALPGGPRPGSAASPARRSRWPTRSLRRRLRRGARGLQYVTDETWIAELGIHYKLGLDGLNLFLVLLAAALWLAVSLWAAFDEPREREGLFFFHLLVGETAVLGALMAQDLGPVRRVLRPHAHPVLLPDRDLGPRDAGERVRAVTKLVIYTLVGSLLMLAAAIALAVLSAQETAASLSFVLSDLAQIRLSEGTQQWIFLCFAAAFLVKMPAFPLHGWMPDGYGRCRCPCSPCSPAS